MSDAPEIGVATYNPPTAEILSPIGNGPPNPSNSMDSGNRVGVGGEEKCTGETDTAGSVTSCSTNITEVKKISQGQMETMKAVPLVGNSVNAQMRTIQPNQNFPSQKIQGGQVSPSNMFINSLSSTPLQTMPSSNNVHINDGLLSQTDKRSSVSGLSSTNGPPAPSLEIPHKSSMPTQPSSSTPIRNQQTTVQGSSNLLQGSASIGAHVSTTPSTSLHGGLYPSPAHPNPSQPSPGRQPSSALLKPQPLPSHIPFSSGSGPIPPHPSAGPFPSQLSGGSFSNQPLAGPIPPHSSAGPIPPQSSGGPVPPQSSAGPFPPHPSAGPVPPQSSAGPVPPRSLGGPVPPQSSAGPFPSHPSAGPVPPQPLGGPIPPQSLAGPVPPQSLAGPVPPQSLAGPVPPQSSAGPFPSHPSAGPVPPQPSAGSVPPLSSAGPLPPQSSAGPLPPQSSAGPVPPQSSAGPVPPQSSAGPYAPQGLGGTFPPRMSSGPYPPQSTAGPFPMQPMVGPYPQQSSSAPRPPYSSPGQFPPPQQDGQFPPKPPMGQYNTPSSASPIPPTHSSSGSFPPQTSSGPFQPSQPPTALAPSSSSFPPSIPDPPLQSSGSYPPFSTPATLPPSSSAQVPPQPFGSFPSNAPLNRPPFPQSSSQQFTPPMPQQPFPPSSSSNSFPAPSGQFTSAAAAYSNPALYMSGPRLPMKNNHIPPQIHPNAPLPPGNSTAPRQQFPSQYPPRPPFPTMNQSSGWAQANGIPNQPPVLETITRQPVPSGVPMYQQGTQQMPAGIPPGVGGGVQQIQPMNDTSQLSKRYPQQQAGYQQYPSGATMGNSGSVERMSSQFRGLSVARDGFNKLWGADCYDLLQTRNILPPDKVDPPKIQLHQEYLDGVNCRQDIFRCTLTKIPETSSLLQKSRLPLGILIHPFKDVNNLPVVQCNTIVRCRACRTYINPFVYFVDHRRWKCNLCFRVNDMPEEFQFDPVTKTYGDPSRRPEIRSSTIEYIAPSEYMLRPPQAAVYLFLLDVSCGAIELGYLNTVCDVLFEELSQLPGDSRTQIGFLAYDSALHFFALADGLSQPQHLVVSDTTEVFLPRPDNLLVNLQECKELVQDLLSQLPTLFLNSHDNGSALGPALQAAYKLMAPTGGRVTVFQTCLPSVGAGALKQRGNDGSAKEAPTQHINPATDFYKRLALDCSGQQVAVDLFVLGNKYIDLATLSGVSQFSGGCIHHMPQFDGRSNFETSVLDRSFHRYLSRKIGFEAVMRIRCSRGLSIHTFHGHFFVRSTDLLSLPNVNPDAGYGMQVAIDESLADLQNVCFQAALLYTSSKGERRIRVHTLCLPLAANVSDVVCAADQQCIVGLLAKMAVDRSHQSSPGDARDAFINVATDVLSTYRVLQTAGPSSGLLSPHSLRLLPLYILALLKHVAFRAGQGARLDERVFAMCQMKCLPLSMLMQEIYPDLYPIHSLSEQQSFKNIDGQVVPCPPRLHLSAEKLDSRGVFLLDRGVTIIIYVGRLVSPQFCQDAFGVPQFAAIQDDVYELHALENPVSELLHNFLRQLQSEKPYEATLQIVREDSRHRMLFIEKLVEDRSESALSYYEFLQHLKAQVK